MDRKKILAALDQVDGHETIPLGTRELKMFVYLSPEKDYLHFEGELIVAKKEALLLLEKLQELISQMIEGEAP